MGLYITKIKRISGTSYSEVYPQAISLYKTIKFRSKRRPYLRSAYFKKEKVFLDYFWDHLREKHHNDRTRRLQQYACGLDLIEYSRIEPIQQRNPKKFSETLYRFIGRNGNNDMFAVQIRENKNGEKGLMSIFPIR